MCGARPSQGGGELATFASAGVTNNAYVLAQDRVALHCTGHETQLTARNAVLPGSPDRAIHRDVEGAAYPHARWPHESG